MWTVHIAPHRLYNICKYLTKYFLVQGWQHNAQLPIPNFHAYIPTHIWVNVLRVEYLCNKNERTVHSTHTHLYIFIHRTNAKLSFVPTFWHIDLVKLPWHYICGMYVSYCKTVNVKDMEISEILAIWINWKTLVENYLQMCFSPRSI